MNTSHRLQSSRLNLTGSEIAFCNQTTELRGIAWPPERVDHRVVPDHKAIIMGGVLKVGPEGDDIIRPQTHWCNGAQSIRR